MTLTPAQKHAIDCVLSIFETGRIPTAASYATCTILADGAGISYHGYGKGTNTPRQEGELVAAFDGSHGWFWRNRTDRDVKITLRTSGEYTEVKQYD